MLCYPEHPRAMDFTTVESPLHVSAHTPHVATELKRPSSNTLSPSGTAAQIGSLTLSPSFTLSPTLSPQQRGKTSATSAPISIPSSSLSSKDASNGSITPPTSMSAAAAATSSTLAIPSTNGSISSLGRTTPHNPSSIGLVAFSEGARENYDPDQYPIYRHQVSGHFPMLWNSAGRICKPASERELGFYQNLSKSFPELLPFVPRFYGVMEMTNVVGLEQLDNDSAAKNDEIDRPSVIDPAFGPPALDLTSETPEDPSPKISSSAPATAQSPIAAMTSLSFPSFSSSSSSSSSAAVIGNAATGLTVGASGLAAAVPEGASASTKRKKKPSKPMNNWVYQCQEKRIDKLNRKTIQYLVLEDLNKVFQKPSILDIKLGTQQHSTDDPPSKIQSKRLKCANTTSASMGLRFCGSQIWHPCDDAYTYRDKYYGRKLDAGGLLTALREFFFNGVCLRTDAIRAIIHRVKAFRAVIDSQSIFQFRSSSLLIIYEGSIVNPIDVEAKFARAFASTPSTSAVASVTSSPSIPPSSPSLSRDISLSSANPFTAFSDVRLIDFAHIDNNIGEKDEGVLLGLDNLLKVLQHILDDSSDPLQLSNTNVSD